MKKLTTEAQLSSEEIWRYDEVTAAASEDATQEVSVYSTRKLASFVAPDVESPISTHARIVVIVENPDDPETIDRLRVICIDHWASR